MIIIVTISESFQIIICYKSNFILQLFFPCVFVSCFLFCIFSMFLSVLNLFVSHSLDLFFWALFVSYCEFL
jgi:hypothetical protein